MGWLGDGKNDKDKNLNEIIVGEYSCTICKKFQSREKTTFYIHTAICGLTRTWTGRAGLGLGVLVGILCYQYFEGEGFDI